MAGEHPCPNWTVTPDDKPESEKTLMGHYWPRILEAVDDGEVTFSDIKLECAICRELLTLFDWEHELDPERQETHGAVIIPCGHIFGAACLKKWFDDRRLHQTPIRCPTCEAGCFHPHPSCRHGFYGTPMPTNVPDTARIPRVIARGGRIAEGCADCRRGKALIDVHNRIRAMADPPDELKRYFIVEVEDGHQSYYSGINAMARLGLFWFPEEVLRFIQEYREEAERFEKSPDVWVSGTVSDFSYALWVRDEAV